MHHQSALVPWHEMTPCQRVQAHLCKTGLVLPEDVPFEDWLALGPVFRSFSSQIQWAIGDWINYGERHYGEKYAQAEAETDYDNGYLRNVAWVARSIKMSLRRDNVPFSYYSLLAVSGMDDTDRALLLEKVVTGHTETGKPILMRRTDFGLLVQDRKAQKGITSPRLPEFNGGLADNAPDDGLPIAPNGKARREREKKEQQEYDALLERLKALEGVNTELREQNEVLSLSKAEKGQSTVQETPAPDAPSVGLPFDDNAVLNDAARVNLNEVVEQQNARIRELEQELAMVNGHLAFYCKIRPYLERIVACLAENEELEGWLRTAAETLEEEKAFYEAGK